MTILKVRQMQNEQDYSINLTLNGSYHDFDEPADPAKTRIIGATVI